MVDDTPLPTLPAGFEWCGGCGYPTRRLTEDDALYLLQAAVAELKAGGALAALDWLTWPLEMHGRSRLGVCDCPVPSPRPEPDRFAGVPREGCHLYRLWTEDGRLLYVGVSTRLRARLRSHVRRWGDLIHEFTWEEHDDERAMLAAEAEAIANEDPALNKAGVR